MNMGMQDLIKFQVMSHMGASIAGPHGGTTGNTKHMSLYHMFMQFIFMLFVNMIDDLCKAIPVLIQKGQDKVASFMNNKVKSAIENVSLPHLDESLHSKAILLDRRHATNSVSMMRLYSHDSSGSGSSNNSTANQEQYEMNRMVDAILSHVTGLDNIPTMRLNPNGQFMVSYKDKPFQICNDVFMKIDNFNVDGKTDTVKSLKIVVKHFVGS
jgi:hypothetical protein